MGKQSIAFAESCAELAAAWQAYEAGARGGTVYPIMRKVARAYLAAAAENGIDPAAAVRGWGLYDSLIAHGIDWLAAVLTHNVARNMAAGAQFDF